MVGAPPSDAGVVSLGGFMAFWGYVFLVTTIFVWVLKTESNVAQGGADEDDVKFSTPSDSTLLLQVRLLSNLILVEQMGVAETYNCKPLPTSTKNY